MKTLSIRSAYKHAWKDFTRRPWYLMGITIAIWVLFILGSSTYAPFTALAYIVFGGYIMVFLAHANGREIVFDDIFAIDGRWISFVFLTMIKFVFIMLGFILLIVPGIYLAIKWMFAEYFVLDQGMRPMEALRASSALTEGHRWKLFFFGLSIALVMLLGAILLLVGMVPAAVIALFATIYMYKTLLGEGAEPESV